MKTEGQLLLPLDPTPDYSLAALRVGAFNHLAVASVTRLLRVRGECLTLIGASGTGKTHLLRGAIHQVQANPPGDQATQAVYLEPAQLRPPPPDFGEDENRWGEWLDHLASCHLVAVDNLELLADQPGRQVTLFHLFNRLRENGGNLLAASRTHPETLLDLRRDLLSRLGLGPFVNLAIPDEEAIATILDKIAQDRQIHLSEELVHFLLPRLPRRLDSLLAAITLLDQAALTRQRPLTVPLAKEVLNL